MGRSSGAWIRSIQAVAGSDWAPPAALGVEATRDQVELGVVTGVERGGGARADLAVTAANVTTRVETPDEQEDERDQEPGGIVADPALAPRSSASGRKESAPRPEIAQGLEDRRLVALRVGPERRRRVHVAPGAVHVGERPRVRVARGRSTVARDGSTPAPRSRPRTVPARRRRAGAGPWRWRSTRSGRRARSAGTPEGRPVPGRSRVQSEYRKCCLKNSSTRFTALRRRHAGEPELGRERGDDRGLLGRNAQVGVDRRPVERAVGAEERGVRDEPEAFLDLHRPEAVSADADDRQTVELERAARKRQDAAPAIEMRRKPSLARPGRARSRTSTSRRRRRAGFR